MQMVILAGGLGMRLRPLTERVPKCLIPVNGRPFLEYQLEMLARRGVRDIVLCVGHLGEAVLDHLGAGHRLGVNIVYSWERDGLLGTAGALKRAEPLLAGEFFVTYGDCYLLLDYRAIMTSFRASDALGMMVVYRNHDLLERSNVVVHDGRVAAYDKNTRLPGMEYINEGLSVLRRRALRLVPEGEPLSQEELYGGLIAKEKLLAYETQQRFYEVGSLRGIEEFQQLMAQGSPA
jgi:NDP-sugar pyrophosphorylase family protein